MALRKIGTVVVGSTTATVHRDSEWNEYRVRVVGASANSDYFTDDKQDAFDTAKALAEWHHNKSAK